MSKLKTEDKRLNSKKIWQSRISWLFIFSILFLATQVLSSYFPLIQDKTMHKLKQIISVLIVMAAFYEYKKASTDSESKKFQLSKVGTLSSFLAILLTIFIGELNSNKKENVLNAKINALNQNLEDMKNFLNSHINLIVDDYEAAKNSFNSESYEWALKYLIDAELKMKKNIVKDSIKTENIKYSKAIVLLKLKRFKPALKSIESAIKLNQNTPSFWRVKGNILKDQYKIEEAKNAYEKELALYQNKINENPKDITYWNSIGLVLHELGRYEEAVETYNHIINNLFNEPNYHDKVAITWYYKELSESQLGKYNIDINNLLKEIEINPNDYYPWYKLGIVNLHSGFYKESFNAFEKSIQLNPKDMGLRFYRCQTIEMQGMIEKAEQCRLEVRKLKHETQNK